jgi:hypothetical protein
MIRDQKFQCLIRSTFAFAVALSAPSLVDDILDCPAVWTIVRLRPLYIRPSSKWFTANPTLQRPMPILILLATLTKLSANTRMQSDVTNNATAKRLGTRIILRISWFAFATPATSKEI